MASEQVSGDRGSEVQEEKPSFFNKVKAKAKQLKSKMKHHGSTEDSHEAAPTSGDPHGQAYAPGPTDRDLDQSDTSESDGEGKNFDIPYTPLNNSTMPHPTRPPGAVVPNSEGDPAGAVNSEQSGQGTDTMKTDNKSLPQDPSVLKSDLPAGLPAETEQAVPTNYSYFNSDPELANRPSDYDASQHKQEAPSSLGGESAELTPAVGEFSSGSENAVAPRDDDDLSKSVDREAKLPGPVSGGDDTLSRSGGRDAELPPSSVASQNSEQKSDVGLVDPSEPSEESLLSDPVEQDRSLSTREPSSHPQNALDGEGQEFSGLTSGDAPSTDKGSDGTPPGWTDPGANYGNASAETDQENHHQGYGGLAAAAAGAAGAGGVAAGVHHEFASSQDQAPGKDEDNSSKLASGDSEGPGFQPAADNLNETGSEALPTSESGIDGSNMDRSFLSSHEQDLGQDNSGIAAEEEQQKPMTSEDLDVPSNDREQESLVNRETESASGLENTVPSKLGSGGQAVSDFTPVPQEATDFATEGNDHTPETLSSAERAPSFDEKPLSEKASEATSPATDATEQEVPTFDDQPLSEKAPETTSPATDATEQKAPTFDDQPLSEKASEASSPATDAIEQKAPTFDDQPLSEKAYEASSPATDATEQKTPTFDEEPGSEKASEAASPAPEATEQKTPKSDASDSSTRKDTPYPNPPPTAAPGLFDRMSGIASSLFGGGAKQPAAEVQKTAGEN